MFLVPFKGPLLGRSSSMGLLQHPPTKPCNSVHSTHKPWQHSKTQLPPLFPAIFPKWESVCLARAACQRVHIGVREKELSAAEGLDAAAGACLKTLGVPNHGVLKRLEFELTPAHVHQLSLCSSIQASTPRGRTKTRQP